MKDDKRSIRKANVCNKEKEEKNMKAEVTKFVNACIANPSLMGQVQRELLKREATIVTKEKEKKTVEKKTSVSPAWQAKLDGRITVGQYNAIIAKKMTLEEALASKKPVVTKEKKVEKAIVTKKAEPKKTRAEGIALFYAKKVGIKVEGRRLITIDNWLELLEEVEAKKGHEARRLEGYIDKELDKMCEAVQKSRDFS